MDLHSDLLLLWLEVVLGVVVRYQIVQVHVVLRVVDEDVGHGLAASLPSHFAVGLLLLHRLPALPRLLRARWLLFLSALLEAAGHFVLSVRLKDGLLGFLRQNGARTDLLMLIVLAIEAISVILGHS